MLRDRPISVKDSKEISREIKGETVADAEEFLQEVIDEETSVPMRQHSAGAGHRSDIDGWDAGRYPEKAAKDFLKLLENVKNNADEQGFDGDEMVIKHVAPTRSVSDPGGTRELRAPPSGTPLSPTSSSLSRTRRLTNNG